MTCVVASLASAGGLSSCPGRPHDPLAFRNRETWWQVELPLHIPPESRTRGSQKGRVPGASLLGYGKPPRAEAPFTHTS